VGYLEPSYSLYPVLSAIAELETTTYPLEEDFQWHCPDMVDVDLFFLTRPNAPTGMSQPLEEVRRLAGRCSGIVVVDEAYGDFASDTAEALVAEFDNVLISRSFSKSYSLAGIRMGYLLGPEPLIQALYKIKDSYNTDVLAQRIAAAAVEDRAWMLDNVRLIQGVRHRTTQALELRGFRVLPSEANFVFAQVPAGRDAEQVFTALRERNVFIRYFPGERTGRYLRITIGTDKEMDRFFEALDEVLGEE
jgi:histidinol-phosphate aminotransferase